jgi:hypothetical protein
MRIRKKGRKRVKRKGLRRERRMAETKEAAGGRERRENNKEALKEAKPQ